MKKDIKQFLSLFLVSVMLVPTLAACDTNTHVLSDPKENESTTEHEEVTQPIKYTLTLSADKSTVLRGEEVTLSSLLVADADDAEDLPTEEAVYTIVAGSEYATIEGDTLTVLATAPNGAKITVQASEGASFSNTVTLTVSVPAESVVISAKNNVKRPIPGQTVVLEAVVTPAGAPNAVAWAITAGADYAKLEDGVLTVNENAPVDAVIKVKATCGTLTSNELEFTVRSATDNVDIEKITITAGASNVLPGATVVITGVYEPSNATNSYELKLESDEWATINGNVLMIKDNAPANTVIKVKAVADSVVSNVLTFTVLETEFDVTKITLTADTLTPIFGKNVVFKATTEPDNATEGISLVITAGNEYASLNGNVLMIKDDEAAVGAIIKVKAVCDCGETSSDEISITVQPKPTVIIPIESITISTSRDQIVKGQGCAITKVVLPENTTEKATWRFLEGADYASFDGDTLVVSDTAPVGATIKVQAYCGNIASEVLTFTVAANATDILATTYDIDINEITFVTDKNGASIPVLTVEVVNMLGETVSNQAVSFALLGNGAQYVKLNASGLTCGLEALGHGEATVEVTLVSNNKIKKAVTVKSIVPPTSVALPEVFAERTDIAYAFSKMDPLTSKAELLPFTATPMGTGIYCQELAYTFKHEDGTTGDEVAVYANGAITFKKTGMVTVTVSSASGSAIEASTSYLFEINEGYNVETFEELNNLVRYYTNYNGETPINFVVLKKPEHYENNDDNPDNDYNYGYALVPPSALLPYEQQTVAEIHGSTKNRIQVVNNSAYINGNNHPIDASRMRVYTEAELKAYLIETYGSVTEDNLNGALSMHSLFSFEPWYNTGLYPGMKELDSPVANRNYSIKLYNLTVKGNASFNHDPEKINDLKGGDSIVADDAFMGAYNVGISLGGPAFKYNVHYSIDSKNLVASGFRQGIAFNNVAEGKVTGLYAYDCYSTGIILHSSIVTLENTKLGLCGATGIEVAPDNHKKAGYDGNQNQKVTFAGTIDAKNAGHDLNSTYFENYVIDISGNKTTVPQIVQGNMQKYSAEQLTHVQTADGKYAIASLLFHELERIPEALGTGNLNAYKNTSEVTYEAYEGTANGIVKLDDITGTDTSHQFILVPIIIQLPTPYGVMDFEVGQAIFYNWNYQAK